VTFAIGEQMLVLAGVAKDTVSARALLEKSISSGAALGKFKDMVASQGGDARVADDTSLLPKAKLLKPFAATRGGFVTDVDARGVALAALRLGAGRSKAEDSIDHSVGIDGLVKMGGAVKAGDPLCVIHAANEESAREAAEILEKAISIGDAAPPAAKLIDEIIG
jgi:pyrimidine-nucleoside phosphorylase